MTHFQVDGFLDFSKRLFHVQIQDSHRKNCFISHSLNHCTMDTKRGHLVGNLVTVGVMEVIDLLLLT